MNYFFNLHPEILSAVNKMSNFSDLRKDQQQTVSLAQQFITNIWTNKFWLFIT